MLKCTALGNPANIALQSTVCVEGYGGPSPLTQTYKPQLLGQVLEGSCPRLCLSKGGGEHCFWEEKELCAANLCSCCSGKGAGSLSLPLQVGNGAT